MHNMNENRYDSTICRGVNPDRLTERSLERLLCGSPRDLFCLSESLERGVGGGNHDKTMNK